MSLKWLLLRRYSRNCSINELRRDLKRQAKEYISDFDKVLFCCEVKFGDYSLDPARHYAHIVTKNQVISASSGGHMGKGVDTFNHHDIVSIREATWEKDHYQVQIFGSGMMYLSLSFTTRSMAKNFAAILRKVSAKG